jgi:transcription termination factor Rho
MPRRIARGARKSEPGVDIRKKVKVKQWHRPRGETPEPEAAPPPAEPTRPEAPRPQSRPQSRPDAPQSQSQPRQQPRSQAPRPEPRQQQPQQPQQPPQQPQGRFLGDNRGDPRPDNRNDYQSNQQQQGSQYQGQNQGQNQGRNQPRRGQQQRPPSNLAQSNGPGGHQRQPHPSTRGNHPGFQKPRYPNQQNNQPNNQANRNPPQRSAPISTYTDIDGNALTKPDRWIPFENLTTIDPQPRLTLEYPGCPASCRLIDLFCPIGRGQRSLIVSPPKAGKTTLLKDIATALLRNHADLEIVVLLIDERPEEVTDFRRTFTSVEATALASQMMARGEAAFQETTGETLAPAPAPKPRIRVVASSNDHTVERHIALATQTIDACKRMVECGTHVVILMDSLTRMGRAFNQSRRHANSGRTMTGGLDSKALEVPRQIFGAARNTEEAGSLTIIASCLVDTGSAADQIIFEEFKGSGNMELILDRKISERRTFPAINLAESGTRKEEKLMTEIEVKTVTALRRRLLSMQGHQQVEQLLAALKRYPTNEGLVGSG